MYPIPRSFYWVFVGSYTQKEPHVDGKGEGIYCYRFLPDQTPHLQLVHVAKSVGINPTFLIATRSKIDRKTITLYAVNECSEALHSSIANRLSVSSKTTGFVRAFEFDETALTLTELQEPLPTLGSYPCHLSLNASNRFLTVSNYGGGSISLFPIENGLLSPATLVKEYTAFTSTNKQRQEASHLHSTSWVSLQNGQELVYGADLGNDCVYHLRLNASAKTLEDVNNDNANVCAKCHLGSGPRHLAIHKTQKLAFILNELSSFIGVHEIHLLTGNIAPQAAQNISTLPSDIDGNLCADIHISNCERFLYASNRGHNSLAAFRIDAEAKDHKYLKIIGWYPALGAIPRSFSIIEDFVIVANQDSDSLQIFKVQQQDTEEAPVGALEKTKRPPSA
uniref:Uncharacterized protein AlNc14C28G2703 n=1 Tax=Albugo laibachii Nc14 TaxID=890382 RepID=F0W775_9STRA|nr:conserved hypothetical protein [Albugo laibachii Nc14]|eukprot:CCA16974.1 conserved hypothetical protein [Albugo laibachii Nc14]